MTGGSNYMLTNMRGRGAAAEDLYDLLTPPMMATPPFGRAVVSRACGNSITSEARVCVARKDCP